MGLALVLVFLLSLAGVLFPVWLYNHPHVLGYGGPNPYPQLYWWELCLKFLWWLLEECSPLGGENDTKWEDSPWADLFWDFFLLFELDEWEFNCWSLDHCSQGSMTLWAISITSALATTSSHVKYFQGQCPYHAEYFLKFMNIFGHWLIWSLHHVLHTHSHLLIMIGRKTIVQWRTGADPSYLGHLQQLSVHKSHKLYCPKNELGFIFPFLNGPFCHEGMLLLLWQSNGRP